MRDRTITVIMVSCVHHQVMQIALEHTLANTPCVEKALVFSDRPCPGPAQHVPLSEDFGYADYNEFVMKQLWPFVDTSHVLLIQPDSWALSAQAWRDEFWQWDYIGAPTEHAGIYNGGFSLRSRRLLQAMRDPTLRYIQYADDQGRARHIKEDSAITNCYRGYLDTVHGLKICDHAVASRFSHEFQDPGAGTFGFHGAHNFLRYLPEHQARELITQMYQHSHRWCAYRDLMARCHTDGIDLALAKFHRDLQHLNMTNLGVCYQ